MGQPWLRAAQKLEFKDPAAFLIRLRSIEGQVAGSGLPAKVRALRMNDQRKHRERRQAALFCHGMSCRLGQTVFLADEESQDYDFIATWVAGGKQHLAPVQLKELVPKSLNPTACIEEVLEKLKKYPASSRDLTVAIHVNRELHFEPRDLLLPELNVAAVWLFAALTPEQSQWDLWGNFTEPEAYGTRFTYPTEA
jgi:hypothetical protein